jgi:hypothetical protein
MKLKNRENLSYYLEEIVWYNICMKKGEDLMLLQGEGGSSTIKVKEGFDLLKGYQICNYFHKEGVIKAYPISKKKKMWSVVMNFPLTEAERWLVYYLDRFIRNIKRKGLKARAFQLMTREKRWVFLFREVGELRISNLYFDYFHWNGMWTVSLESSKLESMVYSSLKVRYNYAVSSRERL